MLETPLLTTFATKSIAANFSISKMLSNDICKESLSTNHLFDTCAGEGSAEISIERWTWVKFEVGEAPAGAGGLEAGQKCLGGGGM